MPDNIPDVHNTIKSSRIPDPDGVANLTIGAATARVALPSGSINIMLYGTVDFYYKLGNILVFADTNSSQLPAGSGEIAVGLHTYIAVLRIGAVDGNLNITKMD